MKNTMKRRSLKRKTAFLLALSMVCSLPQTMNAEAVFNASVSGNRRTVSVNKKNAVENSNSMTDANAVGKIDIAMSLTLLLKNSVEFTATLTDANGNSMQKTLSVKGSEETKISFDKLVDGNYTLTVNAPGFTSFSQNITVAKKLYYVKLTAGLCKGYTYEDGELHPGLLMIGDVNGDDSVGDEDKEILVNTIDGVVYEGKDYATDLNFDKLTDLADLTLLSESYKEGNKNIEAKIEEFVSPASVETEVSENTNLAGSMEDLLSGDGSVSLAPIDGGEITPENPIEVDFNIAGEGEAVEIDGITFETGSENPVERAEINVTYEEDGEIKTVAVPVESGVHYLLKESEVYATIDDNGNINVHLGAQIAVKKVSLKIMAMQKSNNLAEISKVEFINGMEERIPEPEMDIPENMVVKAGSEQFSVNWDPCLNVKGYEIKVELDGKSETIHAVTNSIVISKFNGKELANYTTYKVSVQSVNGSWKSGYCDPVNVTPQPSKRPDKPDNVKATGKYQSVQVSWSKMKDTQSYSVFYKLRNSEDAYTEISNITSTGYTIENLGNCVEYEVYVIGKNELGSSPQSLHAVATTSDLDLADMPKYNLINRDENGKPGSTHIIDVTRGGGNMVNSPLDEGKSSTAWGVVDGDKSSYYTRPTQYDGGWNMLGNGQGIIYTFDQAYTMDRIGLLTVNTDIAFNHIKWWDENNVVHNEWNGAWDYTNFANSKTDAKGRRYYLLQFPKAITATKIQIGTGRWSSPNTVAEVYFYNYNTLMDEVMDLYVDDLHTVLKDDVTQETIDALRVRIEAPDEFGEVNPDKAAQLRELETAEKILKAQSISKAVEIYTDINTKEVGRGFGGLNAWQPLGVSIGMGEEVTIYVGGNGKKTGDSTDLRLIVTQYHSESGGLTLDGANLKVGVNTFKLSKRNLANQENGGAMYIQYQGNATNQRYSVRVTGGTEIPRLDLYKVTDETERMERAVEFIKRLDEHVAQTEELHNQHHAGANPQVNMAYDEKNCIAGASDIMLNTMMISLPAKQIRAGAGNGTVEQRAEKLLKSMTAMEEMMYLFYQHKGLNASASAAINQVPKQHLNIRYQRMFSGAFMYASGNHIGIEWGSATGLVNGTPIKTTEDGKYLSGKYFGWGIAHEIGHNINQGTYAVAEITNNYFAQLAQAKDTNTGMRFQYQNIYNKVTSGTKGNCSNIATQLGMYWQLHLAYDKGLNYKTYSNYTEQLANIFYARVDTYSRNANAAPAPNGIKLTLNGGTDQCLMRLACAAANKNVLEFFERWGKTPDSTTRAYAEQFEKETRAIFYANDDSRIYALNGAGSVLGTDSSVNAISDVSAKIGKAANKVDLKFTSTGIPAEDILGYEVIRCCISGGEVEETPVGFTTGSEFTDTVSTMNNRAVFYKVTLIDQYLNRSKPFTTSMVKIEHDGSMDKTNWTISTSGLTAETVAHEATEEMPCDKTHDNPADQAIDSNLDTVYTPRINNNSAEIIIDFNQTLTATGLKYTAGDGTPAGKYEVYVMTNGEWKLTADGTFNGSKTVYFANDDDKYISTYAATAVKLVLLDQQNQNVSIAELDVLGATGDNVDFRRTETEKTNVIGTLGADYKYGTREEDVIPKGSLVFTGSYKGNPAYNVVILYDDKGNVVGGKDAEDNVVADQIILADVPDNSNIANVSDGTWIYWIEPEYIKNNEIPDTVRVELYRVNNAKTNEGQRLVSDSLFEEVPDTLPTITFGK